MTPSVAASGDTNLSDATGENIWWTYYIVAQPLSPLRWPHCIKAKAKTTNYLLTWLLVPPVHCGTTGSRFRHRTRSAAISSTSLQLTPVACKSYRQIFFGWPLLLLPTDSGDYLTPTYDTNHTPQPQGITSFWLVLIAPIHEGMARLSWPGWLVTYRDKCSATGIEPGCGDPPQY